MSDKSERFPQFNGVSRDTLIAELLNHHKALTELTDSGYTMLQGLGAADIKKAELQTFNETLDNGMHIRVGFDQPRERKLDIALDAATSQHEYMVPPKSKAAERTEAIQPEQAKPAPVQEKGHER